MNKAKLRDSEWSNVRLRPIAIRFDGRYGAQLPTIDDVWTFGAVLESGVMLENQRTRHSMVLPFDHIHHFASDLPGSKRAGFLMLTSQVCIGGYDLWIEPGLRPI